MLVAQMEQVLCRLSPHEPAQHKQRLVDILHKAERDGYWPEETKESTIALINKPAAEHEGQLRPIDLLTYIYRIWMALRRQTQKTWIQKQLEQQPHRQWS